MIRHLRPALSAAELADYTDRLHRYVSAESPDMLDALFGSAS